MGASQPEIRHESDRIRRQTERRLLTGGFGILAAIGGVILWLWYGSTPMFIAVGIILLGAGTLAVLWLLLSLMEAWAKSGPS